MPLLIYMSIINSYLFMDILLQVCIDVVVQRLGDATAAGMYKLLYSSLNGKTTVVSLYALPVRKITFDFLILFFQDFFLGVEGRGGILMF